MNSQIVIILIIGSILPLITMLFNWLKEEYAVARSKKIQFHFDAQRYTDLLKDRYYKEIQENLIALSVMKEQLLDVLQSSESNKIEDANELALKIEEIEQRMSTAVKKLKALKKNPRKSISVSLNKKPTMRDISILLEILGEPNTNRNQDEQLSAK